MARLSALGKGRQRSQLPALQLSDGSSSIESQSDEEYVESSAPRSPSTTRRLRGSQTMKAVRMAKVPTSPGQDSQCEEDMKAVAKGGVSVPFPWKLHEMLDEMSRLDTEDIVCWQPHGRAFMVHKPKEFVDKIMHNFFNQTKYASFQRQLNLYGFSRLSHGRDKGAYYHMCFVRGQRNLCRGMIRQKIKGTKVRRSLAPEEEPNFYSMQWSECGSCENPPQHELRAQPEARSSQRRCSSMRGAAIKSDTGKDSNALPASGSQEAAPISPNNNDPEPKSESPFPLMHISFPTLPSIISARSPSPLAIPDGTSLPTRFQSKPASDAILRLSARDIDLPSSSHWSDNVIGATPAHVPAYPNFAKGGDLLFFEGQPFRYLEHIEVSPGSLPPQMDISNNNIAGMAYPSAGHASAHVSFNCI